MNNEINLNDYNSMMKIMKKLVELYPNNELYKKLSMISYEEYDKPCSDEINKIALHQSYKDKVDNDDIDKAS